MSRRKYFFFDIDGTLIPGAGNMYIPENTREALEQLKEQGHFCAIATGRARCKAIGQCKAMGFHSMVSDGGNGVIIEDVAHEITPLPYELCIRLAQECEEKQIPWAYSSEDLPVRTTFYQEFADRIDNEYQTSDVISPITLRSIRQFMKLYVVCTREEEQSIEMLKVLPHMRYRDLFVFVEPIDKSVGIRRIMEHFDAQDEDVVVFGDGMNDLTMFRPEWTCIAMGNAEPALKERATFVTRDSDDDGIGYALRYFGWIPS